MWPAAEIQFQKVLLREEMGLEITILKLDIDGLVGGNLRKRLWYFGQNNRGFGLVCNLPIVLFYLMVKNDFYIYLNIKKNLNLILKREI